MGSDLKKDAQVRMMPGRRSRPTIAALQVQQATVPSWSPAENGYRIEFGSGEQRIIHHSDLEAVI